MYYIFLNNVHFTVCFYHVTYANHSESTLYSCLKVKELLARIQLQSLKCTLHFMKSVRIPSFSGQYFPAFGLNIRIRTLFTQYLCTSPAPLDGTHLVAVRGLIH